MFENRYCKSSFLPGQVAFPFILLDYSELSLLMSKWSRKSFCWLNKIIDHCTFTAAIVKENYKTHYQYSTLKILQLLKDITVWSSGYRDKTWLRERALQCKDVGWYLSIKWLLEYLKISLLSLISYMVFMTKFDPLSIQIHECYTTWDRL